MAEDGGEDAPSGEPADSGTHTETHRGVWGKMMIVCYMLLYSKQNIIYTRQE